MKTKTYRQLTAKEARKGIPKELKKLTKAQRILAVITQNEGKTAAELASAAFVDHNHFFVMRGLIKAKLLVKKGKGRGAIYRMNPQAPTVVETPVETVTA